jgi:hypothetical protein
MVSHVVSSLSRILLSNAMTDRKAASLRPFREGFAGIFDSVRSRLADMSADFKKKSMVSRSLELKGFEEPAVFSVEILLAQDRGHVID